MSPIPDLATISGERIALSRCYRVGSQLRATNQTTHNTPVVDQIVHLVTIIDPAHPFFGRSFPLVRTTSSRGKRRLVIRHPDGHTQSVLIAATDFENSQASPSPPVLMTISARTLLPVARRLRMMALAMEEPRHGTSSHPTLNGFTEQSETSSDRLSASSGYATETNYPRSTSAQSLHTTAGSTDSAHSRFTTHAPSEGET